MIRLASATISSVRLFSRLEGLSASARFEPSAKIDALRPFPTGLTSIRNPLYSMVVIILRDVALPKLTFLVLRGARCGGVTAVLAPARGQEGTRWKWPIRVRLTNRYDANSSRSAFASFRSRVSKPSVNQP